MDLHRLLLAFLLLRGKAEAQISDDICIRVKVVYNLAVSDFFSKIGGLHKNDPEKGIKAAFDYVNGLFKCSRMGTFVHLRVHLSKIVYDNSTQSTWTAENPNKPTLAKHYDDPSIDHVAFFTYQPPSSTGPKHLWGHSWGGQYSRHCTAGHHPLAIGRYSMNELQISVVHTAQIITHMLAFSMSIRQSIDWEESENCGYRTNLMGPGFGMQHNHWSLCSAEDLEKHIEYSEGYCTSHKPDCPTANQTFTCPGLHWPA